MLTRCLGVVAIAAGFAVTALGQTVDPSLLAGMKWRNIGPFRGGRVSAVTGVIGQPGVFYIGLPLGGVWKTTSAGTTWYPIFDSIKDVCSVGAVEVAPSDPNVVYVGTGDMVGGGGSNTGNGMYKSTDAGKTWAHIGLDSTQQIPRIVVDPHDANLVLAAAQGPLHEKSGDRGIFRSTDGGKTWTRTLFVDDETGVADIARAYDMPQVLMATTIRHYNAPGAAPNFGGGFGGGGGGTPPPSGTAVYKSTDEGVTWTEVPGKGLPRLVGRCSGAIAMNTDGQRMFLVGTFGLYRSDDGGANWTKMAADDRRIANGQGNYTSGVFVDSQNPDIVYTLATSSYRSLDGGKTFTGFKGAPGGDDPQRLWIDPTDGKRMLLGVDQGATVTLDGGMNWSSWYNQPTAQVYHISVDNQYPYWVYATQQDSGSIATCSRGNFGEITPLDWLPHPGYEFGSIVADPLNPKISYAGGPGRGVIKVTYPSGQWIDVSPNIDSGAALRQVGNQPLLFNPNNPHELLIGFQYVMSTTDGGMHWKRLSPDLGYRKGEEPPTTGAKPAARSDARPRTGAGSGGTATTGGGGNVVELDGDSEEGEAEDAQRGGPRGGAIESISVSTVNPGVMWAGTNNGLIKVTKDGGKSWDDASIAALPNATRADVLMVDSSHQDAAEAYAAISLQATADEKPYFYRTRDFGKTWTKIVDGLPEAQPSGSFARAIRADTKKAGLLFAGTESSMYVSLDDGDHWQSLMLNLPNTSYRDIAIHDNDLVVGTYGRSFWVLDDYSPLRELASSVSSEQARLFKPGDAIRVRQSVNGDTPYPPEVPHALNPPLGAVIYYSLGSKPSGDISLEILDSEGKVVRHLSSKASAPFDEPPPPVPNFWIQNPQPMPTEAGLNRINWDIRYDAPPAFSHNYGQVMGAVPFDTPPSPMGPLALPGTYTVKLTVNGKSYTQTLTVKNDPRSPARYADLKAQHDLQMKLYDGVKEAWDGYHQVAAMRANVAEILRSNPAAEVAAACSDFDKKLAAIEGSAGFGRRFGGGGFPGAGGPPPAPSFMGVDNSLQRQFETLDFGDMSPNEPMLKASVEGLGQLKTVVANWKALNDKDLAAFNAVLEKGNVKPIAAAVALSENTDLGKSRNR